MPVDEYTDVEVEMLPQALEVLACDTKWAAIRGGVGSGKTYALCYWILGRMEEYPLAAHFVVGPDYENVRRGFFATFTQILERHGMVQGTDFTYRDSPSPMVILKHSGARLRALSAQLAERIRSVEIQSLLCEEPQAWHNGQAIWEIVSARLRHNPRSAKMYPHMQPQGRFSFNPPSKSSWLFELIERQWPKQSQPCWRFSVRDNVLMVGQNEYVKNLELNLPEQRWAAEIDGHWRDNGGGVYYTFSRNLHTKPIAELPPMAWDLRPDKPIFWTLDFNVNHMASLAGQWHEQPMVTKALRPITAATTVVERISGPKVDGWQRYLAYFLKEFFMSDAGTEDVLNAFVAWYREVTGPLYGRIPVLLYGDPAGGARSQQMSSASSARTNWKIIGQGLERAGIPYKPYLLSHSPSQLDRINMMLAQFQTGSGRGALIDPTQCIEFIKDLEEVRWSLKKENDLDKTGERDSGRTDLTDAAGYMVYVVRSMAEGKPLTFKDHMGR